MKNKILTAISTIMLFVPWTILPLRTFDWALESPVAEIMHCPKKRTSSVISGIFWECTFYSSLWRSSTLPECLSSSRPNPHLQARRLQKAP